MPEEEIIYCEHVGHPEEFILDAFRNSGWTGCHTEGHTIQSILRALLLPGLLQYSPLARWHSGHAYVHHLHGAIQMCIDPPLDLAKPDFDRSTFHEVFHYILKKRHGFRPSILQKDYDEIAFAQADVWSRPPFPHLEIAPFLRSIPLSSWESLLDLYLEPEDLISHGWPDLEVTDGHQSILAEIKVDDALTAWQIKTIPALCDAGFNCRIFRLRPLSEKPA